MLPGNGDLTAAEVELLDRERSESCLTKALASVADEYDVVLIDCPPSLNMLTVNALTASDSVLIPLQCEFYALEGLSALLDTVEQIKQNVNPALAVAGILRTMYDKRTSLTREVDKQLRDYFGDMVLKPPFRAMLKSLKRRAMDYPLRNMLGSPGVVRPIVCWQRDDSSSFTLNTIHFITDAL
ncbi:hypothetical protein HSBAA_66640 [Vreelandella sulfidaeris]|uniref:AAA domain-containing protein n=1 Tax=Vreelandella sulfidaeris TaxID=115553 RepID=A0A455ULZ6_9GAMM|nr:hypothetical protein HSBAA_66640 [Halomonas sulfidaeris]